MFSVPTNSSCDATGGVSIWSAGLTDFAAELQQQCQDVADSNQDSWDVAENDQFFIKRLESVCAARVRRRDGHTAGWFGWEDVPS